MLQEYAQKASRVNELPWMEIARKIADGVNRTDERLDSAGVLMSIEELGAYVKNWRTDSPTVDKLIGWSLFGTDGPKQLAEFFQTRRICRGLHVHIAGH